jgi:hypothetical protein
MIRKNKRQEGSATGQSAHTPPNDSRDSFRYLRSIREILERYVDKYHTNVERDSAYAETHLKINKKTLVWLRIYSAATLVILAVMVFQAYASWQSVIGVQRAFVRFKEFKFTLDRIVVTEAAGQKNMWLLGLIWQNDGNTPTRNLRIFTAAPVIQELPKKPFTVKNGGYIDWPFLEPKIKFDEPSEKVRWMPGVLGPKESSEFGGTHVDEAFIDAVENINENKIVFIWGVARYSDVFSFTAPHITRFCYRILRINGDPHIRSADLRVSRADQCDVGNCTDDECNK